MHPEIIKAMIKMQGLNSADIARHLNVSAASVHNVIHGKFKSNRIAGVIAKTIGKSKVDLWPEIYSKKNKNILMDKIKKEITQ